MPMEQQSELFREFDRKKGNLEKIADKISEKRKRLYVNMPLENIVFGVIVIIMCIITAFALGVERGKGLVHATIEKPDGGTNEAGSSNTNGDRSIPDTILPDERPVPAKALPAEIIPAETVALEAVSVEPASPRYTIQLISYKKEARALKEKDKLANKKMDAFVTKSGKWYQVCVGTYKDMKEAKSALSAIKKEYRSSFVKNL